ncbi:MAG: hypothetical protein ACE5JN_11170 [Candidatus Methylomirabilia bacterium]
MEKFSPEMVDVGGVLIDRHETTNAEFAAFVAATGYRTDPQRSGVGWHWEGGVGAGCGGGRWTPVSLG